MNILIVKMSAIGDVIHTLPALNALRAHFTDAYITWLVEEAASSIIESHEAVDRVIISKRERWLKELVGVSCLKNMRDIFRFIEELRDTRYDLVIDFQGLLKSAVMVQLCRGKRKIGYDKTREFSYLVLNERLSPYDRDKHAILRYLDLIRNLGVNTGNIEFNVPSGKNLRAQARSLLSQKGWNRQPVVAINPMAKWDTKLWDAGNFSRLADMLVQNLGCFVVFTGSKTDEEEIIKIFSGMNNSCANLAGLTDLRVLAALYEICTCLISTDTGPMHLAAAVGSPVVALFGPTAPWRTGPFGEGHQVLRADLSCSPCFKKECDNVACMRHISVEQVFDSVSRILERPFSA